MNAHHGYSKSPKVKHPALNDVKAGDPLLVVKFTKEDLAKLQQRVLQQKMNELFEEPSTYEDEDDDEGEDPLEYCSEDEESADEEFSGDDGEGDYDE